MNEYIIFLKETFTEYGLWFVFPLLLLENFPFVGFFTPAITTLLLAGFLLVNDLLSLVSVVFVSYAGMLVGDNVWFFLGRYSKGKWSWLRKVTNKTPHAIKVLKKQNTLLLIFYQFAPYFRMFLPYTFGITDYSLKKWLIINLIGSLFYVTFFVSIGYISATLLKNFEGVQLIGKQLNIFLITISVIYGFFLIRKIRFLKNEKN